MKAARAAFDAGYNAGRASLEPVATALYEALETTREAWSDALSIREPDYWSETEIAEHRVIATKADAALAAARDAGIGS